MCTLVALKKRTEFLAVASAGKKWITPAFILQKGPRSDAFCGFGLTASIKTIGNAVRRNRARRRLRALVREVLPPLPLDGTNFVLIAREKALTEEYAKLRKDLMWALGKLNAAGTP